MKTKLLSVLTILTIAIIPSMTSAHCDTLDGPVVSAAKKSIETKNPDHFLIWVRENDESKALSEFNATLSSRVKNPDKANEIDTAFFETLVRIHREGEWAPYTWLKAGKADEITLLADAAIDTGSWSSLKTHLQDSIAKAFDERFAELMKRKGESHQSVATGREYVESYVTFLHWAEGLFVQPEHHAESGTKADSHEAHSSESKGHTEGHFDHLNGENLPVAFSGMFLGMAVALMGTWIFRRKS